ncbi:DUF5131 family protein [Streptomyces canus]|uniref:DUF5131 family protein n=1 Tax=Streptomyces canus TaxID=58343 RepID=UPI0036B012D5
MTTIEWTDEVWNPTTGCDRTSPGCDGCYALTMARRLKGMGQAKYQTDGDPRTSGPGFGIATHPDALTEPLRWRKSRRVFVNSMSDLFHAHVPVEFITDVWRTMQATPQHTYQILTKRAARLPRVLDRVHEALGLTEPLPNVWLGVSVESQKYADLRIPALLETPAAVRFLSCEPLLGPIDLSPWLRPAPGCGRVDPEDGTCTHPDAMTPECHRWADCPARTRYEDWGGPDWVIVGGESGPKARAMHPKWARQIRDACDVAGVPFFFKQWGEWGPADFIVRVCDPDVGWQGTDEELAAAKADSEARGATHAHTGGWHEVNGEREYWLHEIGHKPWSLERVGLPDGTAAIRRWGKKRAGRELDGRLHEAFPA